MARRSWAPVRWWRPLVLAVTAAALLVACGGDDTTESSSTTESASSAPTAGGTLTVERVISAVQAELDEKFAASDPPEGVLGAIELQCLDSGPVGPSDVFACAGMPRTEPSFALDPVGVVFYVVDESGTTASIDGTDVPDTTAALRTAYDAAPKGLFCRDLLSTESSAHPFTAAGRPPAAGFFWSLVYWSLEGQPERMDADLDGIPCETLYDAAVVSAVLAGG